MIFAIGIFFILSEFFNVTEHYNAGISSIFSSIGKGMNQETLNLLVTQRTSAIASPFEEHSFLSRIALWKYLLILSTDPINAFMGRGIGTINADSLYFSYLAQLGYPGMIFIIGFVILTIINGFNIIDRSNSPMLLSLAKGITLMNIVFAIINITGTHIHSFPGDVYFWFWNGVLFKLSSMQQAETGSLST
jgi:hypothetical protein